VYSEDGVSSGGVSSGVDTLIIDGVPGAVEGESATEETSDFTLKYKWKGYNF
jgi:hypothetical protein